MPGNLAFLCRVRLEWRNTDAHRPYETHKRTGRAYPTNDSSYGAYYNAYRSNGTYISHKRTGRAYPTNDSSYGAYYNAYRSNGTYISHKRNIAGFGKWRV